MKRILKEPLLHFFLLGVGLFVVYGLANDSEPADSGNTIIVSSGRIEQLATVFGKTWQRPPTARELNGLIDDFVLEEAYYRQAVAMGIDRDDTIIRRRLRQKLEFLTDDAATLVEPSDEELAEYLAANEDRFRSSAIYTFEQIYFNPENYGNDPEAEIADQLSLLRSGTQVGDVSLLPPSFDHVDRESVESTFGSGFPGRLDELEVGDWQGPVRSGLGIHLIKIKSRTPGHLPELAQIRPLVAREWNNEKRLATRREMNDSILEHYEVVIEWPEDADQNQSATGRDHP